jgi:hypothetical protein
MIRRGDKSESSRKTSAAKNICQRPQNSGDGAGAVIELVKWPDDCGWANAGVTECL